MNLKEKTEKSTNLVEHKITMKKLKKQVKGITLIALVVTIVLNCYCVAMDRINRKSKTIEIT